MRKSILARQAISQAKVYIYVIGDARRDMQGALARRLLGT